MRGETCRDTWSSLGRQAAVRRQAAPRLRRLRYTRYHYMMRQDVRHTGEVKVGVGGRVNELKERIHGEMEGCMPRPCAKAAKSLHYRLGDSELVRLPATAIERLPALPACRMLVVYVQPAA